MLSSGTCVQSDVRQDARISGELTVDHVSAMRSECCVALVQRHVEDAIQLRHAVAVSPELGSGVFSVCQATPCRVDLVARFDRALFAAGLPSRVIPTRCLSARVFGVVLALKAIPKLRLRLLVRDHGISVIHCFSVIVTRVMTVMHVTMWIDPDRWSRTNTQRRRRPRLRERRGGQPSEGCPYDEYTNDGLDLHLPPSDSDFFELVRVTASVSSCNSKATRCSALGSGRCS
jgi:hypothetical protein